MASVATGAAAAGPARRPGRKRDSSAERRILRAALDVFTTGGWRGFTIDTVARAAAVGKSTIYLRYQTREELVLALLAEYGYQGAAQLADHGSLHADLEAFALSYAGWLDGPAGALGVRIAVERRLDPDFAEALQPVSDSQISQAHEIVHRAKQRGEIPLSVSSAAVLDAIVGGLINHTMTAPDHPAYASAGGQRFVTQLVGYVLYGVIPAR